MKRQGKRRAAAGRRREDDYSMVLALYQRVIQYADLLEAAGNIGKATEVREECRALAREGVLERLLNPGWCSNTPALTGMRRP